MSQVVKGLGDPDGPALALLGATGTLLVVVIVFALEAFYYSYHEHLLLERNAQPYEELVALRAEQEERASSYAWVDRDAGQVRIPVDRAAELVLAEGLGGEGE